MSIEHEQKPKKKKPPKRTDKQKLRCWDCNTDLIEAAILHQEWIIVKCAVCGKTLFYNGA